MRRNLALQAKRKGIKMNEKDIKEKNTSVEEKDTAVDEKAEEKSSNENKKYIIALIAALVVIAVVILVVSLTGKPSDEDAQEGDTASATETEETTAQQPTFVRLVDPEETYPIDLGFVKLRFPEEYKDTVKIDGVKKHEITDVFTLSFTADKKQLFDLSFNKDEKKGGVLGTLLMDEGNVVVYVKTYALDQSDVEHIAMQESLNVIIEALISDYDFVTGEIIKQEDTSVFEIKTDVTTLYYPNKWKDKVTVKEDGKTVSFMIDKRKLFDLRFEKSDGYLLGTYDGTPIYMVEYKAENDDEIAMQQDVNVIIEYLSKDKKFEINA